MHTRRGGKSVSVCVIYRESLSPSTSAGAGSPNKSKTVPRRQATMVWPVSLPQWRNRGPRSIWTGRREKRQVSASWLMEEFSFGSWSCKNAAVGPWKLEEIAAYEARQPIGSAARTAFALLLFTGQRMADVSRMAWTDVGEGAIRVVQGKTGAKLSVPLHPDLGGVLAAWPRAHERILPTAFGKPFTPKGFGNWMADKIGKAGAPDRCVTHGLRKAAARRLAEAGYSANEIAAITGHATLTEVSRYTKAAEQRTLARSAIGRLAHKPSAERVPNPSPQFGKARKNPMISTSICSTGAPGGACICSRSQCGRIYPRRNRHHGISRGYAGVFSTIRGADASPAFSRNLNVSVRTHGDAGLVRAPSVSDLVET